MEAVNDKTIKEKLALMSPEARRFYTDFHGLRETNIGVYRRVPEDKLDFQMAPNSDSPRKSMMHQVRVTRDYLNGIESGELDFNREYGDLKDYQGLSKEELLSLLKESEDQLIDFLTDPATQSKMVKVPWSAEPVPALSSLWGMRDHEILHNGWNLAVMDCLEIPRFDEYRRRWG